MSWWISLFHKRALDAQLDSELRFHIDELTDTHIEAGLTPEEARRQAILEFGGREQIKEELRDVRSLAMLESTLRNLKSAMRFIRKSPSFAITVVITLALSIGANSAVFSAIDAILLRPLPFPDSDQLMRLDQHNRKAGSPGTVVAPVRLEEWNRMNSTFQAITGYYTDDASETTGALPEKVTRAFVAPRFQQVWGISPELGRNFSPEEERSGGPGALLISDRFWRRRFGADPHAIGKTLRIGAASSTIIGVLPASFLFPVHEVDIWSPVPPDAPIAQGRDLTWYTVIGRLKPGVPVAQARADLAAVQARLGDQFPKTDAVLAVGVQPLKEITVGGVGRSLWLLFGSVTLLLLIACTNIAALLLARATQRQHEIAIRFALGASRTSVVAQLLTEAFVLALAGAVLGLAVAAAASRVFRALAANLPRVEEIRLDWRIVLYSLACAVIATLLSGLFPALRGTRKSLSGSLTLAGRTQVSARNPLQWTLVGIQVALAVTLLTGAGLLLRSFQELGRVNPGFDPSRVLTFHISGSYAETANMKNLRQRVDRTLDFLRAVPGVEAAASSMTLPGVVAGYRTELKLVEGRAESEPKITAFSRFVSPGYFATMRIPLLAGEDCREEPVSVLVVNRSFANAYFPGSPIGHHLQGTNTLLLPPSEIRGVVGDAREEGLSREPAPTVYWCFSAPDPDPFYLVRTRLEPLAMSQTIRRKMHEIEPSRSVFDILPLDQHIGATFAENRLRTVLLAFFAITAVLLACVGLYGTLSYFVSVRQREVGLRLALGAMRRQIVSQFLFQGLRVSILGCIAGLALAAAFTRLLSGMLYGVSSSDAATLITVVFIVLAVAAIASLIPAIRAARVEPMTVLREE